MSLNLPNNNNNMNRRPLLYSLGTAHIGARSISTTLSISQNNTNNDYLDNESTSIESFLPGTFIVLQGVSGDGMQNTIDILPELPTQLEHLPVPRQSVDTVIRNNQHLVTPMHLPQARVIANRCLPSFLIDEIVEPRNTNDEEKDCGDSVLTGGFQHVDDFATTNEQSSNLNSSSTSAMLSSLESSEEVDLDQHQQIHGQTSNLQGLPFARNSVISNSNFSNAQFTTSNEGRESNSNNDVTKQDESFIVIQPRMSSSHDVNNHSPSDNIPIQQGGDQEVIFDSEMSNEDAINESILEWNKICREKEKFGLQEAINTAQASPNSRNAYLNAESNSNPPYAKQRWWQRNGKLVVLESLPDLKCEQNEEDINPWRPNILYELSPGTTVVGTEIIKITEKNCSLDAFSMITSSTTSKDIQGSIYEFLKIESPFSGFVLYRLNGYNYLGHGLAGNYTDPMEWMWRVIFTDGAIVREGIDLSTDHLTTLSFGSLVPITAKTVNSLGLSRLKVELPHMLDDGWVSESLNPLAGQRGKIIQPLPFPVPVLYKVILDQGAVIRKGIELSSPEVRTASYGTILKIIGRAFSNYPEARCVERLRLAGDEGWISLRLNLKPPRDKIVVEMVGLDGSFDPDNPGLYHINALVEVNQRHLEDRDNNHSRAQQHSFEVLSASICLPNDGSEVKGNAASTDGNNENSLILKAKKKTSTKSQGTRRTMSGSKIGSDGKIEEHCLICLTEERNATIIHEGTGHIACCLDCARILKGRGDKVE